MALWSKEPTLILAAISAALAMGMGFGLPITPQQMGLVMACAAAVLGLINRAQVTSPASLQALTPATLAAAQDATVPVKDTVRKLPVILLATTLLGFLVLSGCAAPAAVAGRSTAKLTTPGLRALHTLEIVKSLDVVRDAAIDAEASKIIPTATATKVIRVHKAVIDVIRTVPNGWKSSVLQSLTALGKDLTSSERAVIGPYINAATLIIKAVIQ